MAAVFKFLLCCFVLFTLACDASTPAGQRGQREASVPSNGFEKIGDPSAPVGVKEGSYRRKINFIYRPVKDEHLKTVHNQQTPTPPGWEAYDGSPYTRERGYGWLTDLRGYGRDRGLDGLVVLPDGTRKSPRELGRPELANFQSRHRENDLLVFRIDLPDGWYRVSCASVDPDTTRHKPLVDRVSFKCRAHDVVFAGADLGAPLVVGGRALVEGSGVVEATDGHLRLVIGDPAYAGWTWKYPGPPWGDLKHWWRVEYNYAETWYGRLTRRVDPGFHSMALNALEIERVAPRQSPSTLRFRDFFNRNDSRDVNAGVAPNKRWRHINLHPRLPDRGSVRLYKTAVHRIGSKDGPSVAAMLQQEPSPAAGVVRYSTRVSLFSGEGSRKHSGAQEAGILLLADPSNPTEYSATFVGVQIDPRRPHTMGRLIYRVGDGRKGYRSDLEVADTALPFKIAEGEFEIIVEHDAAKNFLRHIKINGVDVTGRWTDRDRAQPLAQGLYGIRSAIHNTNPDVSLRQYYWYYRVEALSR